MLGLESRARGPVKGQRKELAIVEHLASAIAPSDIKVIVQVASGCNIEHQRASQ